MTRSQQPYTWNRLRTFWILPCQDFIQDTDQIYQIKKKSTWSRSKNEEKGSQIMKLQIEDENYSKSKFEKFRIPFREVSFKKSRNLIREVNKSLIRDII